MAAVPARPGDPIDIRPLGPALATAKSGALFKSGALEVVRIVMTAGKKIAPHRAPGDIVIQCLEGRIAVVALGDARELQAGQLLYLTSGEPHSIRCLEDASFLLTIVFAPPAR